MSIESLAEKAYNHLANARFLQAKAVGDKLIAKGSPVGFSVKANALVALDQAQDALEIVELGLEEFPDEWVLYNDLGTVLIELERIQEAVLAYNQALAFDDVDRPPVSMNLASAHAALDQWEEALEALEGNEEWGELDHGRMALQLAALAILGRWKDALAFTDGLINEMGEDLIEAYGTTLTAAILSLRACALLRGKKKARRAENQAWDALRVNPKDELALEVVRECGGHLSPFARQFMLQCALLLPDGATVDVCYMVIADTAIEAMEYILAFEAQISGGVPGLQAEATGEPAPDDFCGVCRVIDEDDFADSPFPGDELDSEGN